MVDDFGLHGDQTQMFMTLSNNLEKRHGHPENSISMSEY